MTVYAELNDMPHGYEGDVVTHSVNVIEPVPLSTTKTPSRFGVPVKLTAGIAEKIEAGDTANSFFGVLVRKPFSQGHSQTENTAPQTDQTQDILTAGFINVACKVGTPVRNGAVYMRVVVDGVKAIGDFEATADGVNNVLLTDVVWAVGGKDSENITTIKIK